MDYSIHDAIEAGFNHVVFIIRKDIEKEFKEVIGDRIDSICSSHNVTVAVIAAARNIPTIRHLLQHSRRSARWIDVLCSDESKKASVKLDEIVIYWER